MTNFSFLSIIHCFYFSAITRIGKLKIVFDNFFLNSNIIYALSWLYNIQREACTKQERQKHKWKSCVLHLIHFQFLFYYQINQSLNWYDSSCSVIQGVVENIVKKDVVFQVGNAFKTNVLCRYMFFFNCLNNVGLFNELSLTRLCLNFENRNNYKSQSYVLIHKLFFGLKVKILFESAT